MLGELSEEIEERIKYAKWKAADIIKALNEGRLPNPGPPNSSPQHIETTEDSSFVPLTDTSHLPSFSGQFSPTGTAPPSISAPLHSLQRSSPPIVLPSISMPSPVSIISPAVNHPSLTASVASAATLANAEKLARYSLSAIQFEDVPTAIKNMEQALAILHALQDQQQ